jgi:hypothetical protein
MAADADADTDGRLSLRATPSSSTSHWAWREGAGGLGAFRLFRVPPFEEAREVVERLETEVRFDALPPTVILLMPWPWLEVGRDVRLPILALEDIGLNNGIPTSKSVRLSMFQHQKLVQMRGT